MLRIQATIGLTTYYFASEALDYANRYWEPRISNAFQISREFNSADKTGNKIRSVDISLDNRDGFFNNIYTADGLVNGKFVLYFNEGDHVVKTFTGRVNKIKSFGDDISLTLREVGYEYLTRKFPDAQIAYDYYSASGINDSWNAIPIHLGTVNRYPCPWVNLFESHFIIGSGPIHAVKKIYFDKTVVYDSSTGQNGYKATPESPEIKFRIFKGARAGNTDIVEGVASSYPGFAYIQLYKIVDAVEQPADPVNPDGEAVQIYVDIEGLQNEAGTDAERNPAQILYQFFTKPYTAEEGYGLAISPDDLDFSAAITECGIQGFKIDGSIDNTTDFGEWIDEILRCCRGQLYENNGKISVRIDSAAASPTIHFDETGELGYNCIVDTWNEPERDAQTNRVRLSYSWNFENSNFNKKPSYNQESPIGDTNLQNPTHANRIQKWNTETLEYKLIKDDTTAHKLAQYYLNNIVKQLITTSLTTEVDIPNTVDAGTVVKVTSPKFGWSEKLFRITSISRSEENTEIQLKEYDASIFTFIDPGTVAETGGNQYSVYNIPAKPEMTSLDVVNEILADGSTQTRINVNFVAPTENSQLVALYYKPSGGTEADFKPLDTVLSSAGTMSAIWKGIESGNYNFRLVTISPVGIYSDLSIVSGDKHYYGQPGSEGTVSLTGDTIAPGKPSIDDFLLVQGAVTLHFNIPTGFPSDFSHFAVYRKLNGGSLLPLDMKYTGRLFTDTDVAGYVSRQYSIVAYDKSNNPSESSDLSVAMTPLKVLSDDITDQPIIGKCFLTGTLVGVGNPGIRFDSTGIYGYSATQNTFTLCAATGNVSMTGTITALAGNIGGFTIDPIEGLHAGCTTTRVQMKPGAGFWAGATAIGDAPFSVTQAGVLKATSGTIGGWTLASASLSSTNAYIYSGAANTARVEMGTGATSAGINSANAGTDISFWAGSTHANRATAPFRVTAAGVLTATNANITGAITATSGTFTGTVCACAGCIAGFSITNAAGIYSGSAATRIQMLAGTGLWLGADAIGDAPFSVTQAGVLKSTSGTIGGWNIYSGGIRKYGATAAQYLSLSVSGCPTIIISGCSSSGATYHTFGGCLFNGTWLNDRWGMVLRVGGSNLFQVHSCIDGVNCYCAQIAGWNFNATQIYSTGCGLILCNTGAIQTGDFVTSNKGWKIDSVGNAEFNNICARGAIRTAVFIKDQISVVGGCTMIRPAGVSAYDCTPASDTFSVYVNNTVDQFAINDLIRIKDGVNDYWGRVYACGCNVSGCYISFVKCSGTRFNFTKGQAIVNYGSCLGCGGIMLNGQCPYIDIYTHAGLPWSALCSRVRIGNLNGWGSDFQAGDYGWVAGCPTGHRAFYTPRTGLCITGNVNALSGCIGCFCLLSGMLRLEQPSVFTGIMMCNTTSCSCTSILTDSFGQCSRRNVAGIDVLNCMWVSGLGVSVFEFCGNGVDAFKSEMWPGEIYIRYCCPYSVSVCSQLQFTAKNSGVNAGDAGFKLCVYGGASCYAMCTNGQIQASCFVGSASHLNGYAASTTYNSANTIPIRDANGYLYLGWINTASGVSTTTPTRIYASQDGFIRYYTPACFINLLGLVTTNAGMAKYAQYLCIHSSNEVTWACGYAGGALYVNYRGTTGAITCYIFGTGMCSGFAGLCSGNIGVSGNVYASTCLCSPIICGTSCVRGTFVYSSGRIEASRLGFVGTYNSAQTQGIWSIGSSYMPDATTTDFNTLYGMGYSYSTVGGGYFSRHHQVHWVNNGTVNASMSLSGYLWVRNYVISTCVLGTTCVCGAVTCGTTCVISPVVCGTTCLTSPVATITGSDMGTTTPTRIYASNNNNINYYSLANFKSVLGIGSGSNVAAWINFNGTGTISIRGSGGVSSIVDCGTGYYRVNFSTAMSSANYAAVGTAGPSPAYLNMPYNTAAYATTYYLVGTGSYSAMIDACFVALAFII